MDVYETRLNLAIQAYKVTEYILGSDELKVRPLATQYDVSRTTLTNRILGVATPRSEAFTHLQALSVDEEKALVDYVRRSSLLGHPPPCYLVKETAEAIRQNRLPPPSSLAPLGKNWLDKFRRRHPEVSSVWSRQLDTSRFEAVTVENLAPWFAEVGAIINQHHYKPEDIYNMDETGHGIGLTQSTRVLVVCGGDKGQKATKTTSGRQEWVTTIECVSASGRLLPPLVIFRATGSINARWLPEELEVQGWRWTTSNTGWTNDTLSFDWLQRVFEPCTTPSSNQRRLLILDGHGSHVKARFIAFCIVHKIDLMVLPSHTSHKTQPLDFGIFSPLKAAMARQTDRAATYDHGRVAKHVWASRLAAARIISMTERNIRTGWRETGLYPFCPNRLLDSIPSASPSIFTPIRQPLAVLPSNTPNILRSYGSTMLPPVKDHLKSVVAEAKAAKADAEGLRAQITVLGIENKGLRDAAEGRKGSRDGFTVKNVGTHVFTTEDVLRQAVAREALTASRKRKKARKTVSDDDQRLVDDVP